MPLAITPLVTAQLEAQSLYRRERDPKQSTDFSFTRFLVPHLMGYQGWALFLDCDMLCRADIKGLWEQRDDRYGAMCVQHEHVPGETVKFLGEVQSAYPKKNWSSLILFNNEHPSHKFLDVNGMTPAELHQFDWIADKDLGELPKRWNWLVGYCTDEDLWSDIPAALHYTDGGPWFEETKDCDYSGLWNEYYAECLDANKICR